MAEWIQKLQNMNCKIYPKIIVGRLKSLPLLFALALKYHTKTSLPTNDGPNRQILICYLIFYLPGFLGQPPLLFEQCLENSAWWDLNVLNSLSIALLEIDLSMAHKRNNIYFMSNQSPPASSEIQVMTFLLKIINRAIRSRKIVEKLKWIYHILEVT